MAPGGHLRWYRHGAVRGSPFSSVATLALCGGLGCLLISGCGEASPAASEPTSAYRVRIVGSSFPDQQRIAQATTLELQIRNTSLRTIPNLAVTLHSLDYIANYPHLSDPRRPVWIIDKGPGPNSTRAVQTATVDYPYGGSTAYVATWALGPLGPGRVRTFAWQLTPVKAGIHRVFYVVAAGLNGKARAVLADGSKPVGGFLVHIAPAPAQTHVNAAGQVAVGPAPLSQTPVGAVP
jgi:hypothetical protein